MEVQNNHIHTENHGSGRWREHGEQSSRKSFGTSRVRVLARSVRDDEEQLALTHWSSLSTLSSALAGKIRVHICAKSTVR